MSSCPTYSVADLAALDRRSLQKLCKRADVVAFAAARGHSLRANAKTEQLVAQLADFFAQISGDDKEQQQQQHSDEQSNSDAEADEAAPAAAAEQPAQEAAPPAEADMECATAEAAQPAEESAEQQEQQEEEEEAEAEGQTDATSIAAPASLLPASGLAEELAAASADAQMMDEEEEEDEDEYEDEMEPVAPLAGDIHMDDFPELPAEAEAEAEAEQEEERTVAAFAPADADPERDAKEQEELEALEAEIGDLQAQLVQAEQPAAPVARASKAAGKKSVAHVAASNKKKSIAPKKSVAPSVAAMADKRKSTKKAAAPAAAVATAPVAAAAPLFKKKAAAVTRKAAPAAAAAAPIAATSAAAEPVMTIPTSFDFPSSASTTTAAAAVPAAAAPVGSPAPATAAASSSSSSMDAYWSLMAELDKRVVEKQRVAVVAGAAEDASAPAVSVAVAATPSAALGKKTAAKFDKIHKAAANKSESIVDHYNKLNEKKRAAQMATPLASGLKRAKHAHQGTVGAGSSLPQHSPAPFVLAPLASPAAPASGFTEGFKAVQTPGVAKRTRASLKKEKTRHAAPAAASVAAAAPAKLNARKSVAVKKLAPAASGASSAAAAAAPESRPLFTSRMPVRPSAAAPPTTFTQIACLEDVRAAPHSNSASTASAAAAKKKFDIAASLAKPVSWKMHKGKIGQAKAKAAATAAADKENAPVVNPFVSTTAAAGGVAAEEKAKSVDSAFSFSFQPGVHSFTAPVTASTAPTAAHSAVLQPSKAQPSASAAGTSRRDGIKTVRMGADKDAKRSNFNANKQSSRNKAMTAARDRMAV